MESLEEALKDLASMDGCENCLCEDSKMNLDTVIVANKQIHEGCYTNWLSMIVEYLIMSMDSMKSLKNLHERR